MVGALQCSQPDFGDNNNYTIDINNIIILIKDLATAESLLKVMLVMEKMQITE
jgi:hypothetical protein